MQEYHIAQFNAALLVAPLEDPKVREFVDALGRINALAEASKGFVWRLQTEAGNATAIRIDDNPLVIVNMSVWEDIDSLYHYAYKDGHGDYFGRRREWLRRWERPSPVLWWVSAEHIPTLDEALDRVAHVETHGPTAYAFNFKRRFTSEQAAAYVDESPSP